MSNAIQSTTTKSTLALLFVAYLSFTDTNHSWLVKFQVQQYIYYTTFTHYSLTYTHVTTPICSNVVTEKAKQKMDEAKFVSINIWHRHTACVYRIVFNICDRLRFLINIWYPQEVWNNFLVEILWKLLGCRTYGQRVVSFADKFLFAFCFFVWQHYCNHVSICWFKLKLERFPKNS